jgi:dipeptidyl-peptidase 4
MTRQGSSYAPDCMHPALPEGVPNVAAASLPAQIVRTRRFTLGAPGRFTVTPDGSAVLFLRSRAGDDPVTCLWWLDLASGTERLLADPAGLLAGQPPGPARGEHARGGPAGEPAAIGGYATDLAAQLAVFALAGGLWAVDTGGGPPRLLPACRPAADPRPDPAARRIAYLCGGSLRVIRADGTGDRLVMLPEGPDVSAGAAEHTAATPADAPRGYWWAPDGARLLAARVDYSGVERRHIADPAEPAKAPRVVRYPAAGTASPEVTLWIVGLDGSRTQVRWDREAFEYLVRAGWDTHGPHALVQSRDQRTARFLAIDPGSGESRVLREQRDACWVQLVPGLPARTASGALVAHLDRPDTRHLTVDGVPVTPPGLELRAVLGVEGEQVLFTASREPAEIHLWSYRPGDGIRRLSSGPGLHSGVRRGGTLVHVAHGPDDASGRAVAVRDNAPPVAIASRAELPAPGVRAVRLVLGPRELRAALYLPSWHRPGGGRLPILADPYGGASLQRVTAALDWRSLVSQWFAEQGFAVLVADGRGTPGRGPGWEREVYGDLYGPVLEDQVTAVQEAARLHPDLDPGRTGIRGWSFGGSLAAVAVLRRPDVFHAAVAGAPVTDQRLYNAHWRERFLGHPAEFPQRYDAASLVQMAPELTRPLLLIHGLADGNVYPANTLRLSSALLAAGRPHEVLLVPGAGHQAMDAPAAENLLIHQARFLQRHLGAAPPHADADRAVHQLNGPGGCG